MSNGEIRAGHLNLNQVMATQDKVVTTEVQDMMAQGSRDVAPRVNQNVSTMDLHLRNFIRKNPPIFLSLMSMKILKTFFIRFIRSNML